MTSDETRARINSIMISDFEIDPSLLKPEANLRTNLGLDSLDGVDLVVAIEREFHVRIEEEEARSMTTLQDIYDYIIEHSGAGRSIASQ